MCFMKIKIGFFWNLMLSLFIFNIKLMALIQKVLKIRKLSLS